MAKKSAKSKGYRKTIKQKPFLTKKEIITLAVIVVAILLGVVLFNIFYDDGFIDADQVQQGDIVSYASTNLRDRYMKIAEIGEIEGFTLEERAEDATPIEAYTFTPDGDADHVTSVIVNGSFVDAASLANSTVAFMQSAETSMIPEIHETTIQGHTAYVFGYTYSEYDESYGVAEAPAEEAAEAPAEEAAEAPAEEAVEAEEEPAPNKFSQNLSAYVALDDTHTLCLHVYRQGSDESFYLPEDQIPEYIQQFETAFTLAEEE